MARGVGHIAVLVLTNVSMQPLSADDAVVRFNQEAAKSWRSYVARLSDGFQARYDSHVKYYESGVMTREMHLAEIVKMQKSNRLLEVSSGAAGVIGESSEGEVESLNELYAFKLGRSGDGIFHISQLSTDRPPKAVDVEESSAFFAALPFACANCSCLDLVESKRFRVLSATETDVDGENLLEVRFEVEPSDEDGCIVTGGKLNLDPNRYWMIVNYVASVRGAYATLRGENEYDLTDSLPLLRKRSSVYESSADASTKCVWECEAELLTTDPPAASEFTLSHYGFSEPGAPGQSGGRKLGLLLINVGAIVILILFVVRRRYLGAA